MTLHLTPNLATLSDVVGVEDADALREWCAANVAAPVDLAGCTHLHAANLQVLMAARPRITRYPSAGALDSWLRAALSPSSPSDT